MSSMKEKNKGYAQALQQTNAKPFHREQDVIEPGLPDLVEARPAAQPQTTGRSNQAAAIPKAAQMREAGKPAEAAKQTAAPQARPVQQTATPQVRSAQQTGAPQVRPAQQAAAQQARPAQQTPVQQAHTSPAQPAPQIPAQQSQASQVKPAPHAPAPQTAASQARSAATVSPQPAQPAANSTSAAGTAKAEAQRKHNRVVFGLEPVLPYSIEEAVNRLRINISFLGADVKKIMIVSSEPNEGKSFIALNLWKQMARAGERSVLVDLDMRKSTMFTKYKLKREDGQELKGTSHFLSGNDPIEDVVLSTDMEYGDLLPNVDNIINPSMLLESRKFTEMMEYMQTHYRYVFIDVPPLRLVSDGELIGSICDGAVLCVRGGETSRNVIRRSIQQLERAGCPVLGIVLNRVGGSSSGYYHKYYGKKYYYNDKYYYGK